MVGPAKIALSIGFVDLQQVLEPRVKQQPKSCISSKVRTLEMLRVVLSMIHAYRNLSWGGGGNEWRELSCPINKASLDCTDTVKLATG